MPKNLVRCLIITFSTTMFALAANCGSSGEYPQSCKDVLHQGHNVSGFYLIQPENAPEPFLVPCNMESSGGGWTTILNRVDGSIDFYRNWISYKQGFGNLGGEFWLGLEKIHQMTRYQVNELLFELTDWENQHRDAHYEYFVIGSEEEGYSLKLLKGFSGSAGDSLISDGGMKFSTHDRDQDPDPRHCAQSCKGAWWYHTCGGVNLAGKYGHSSDWTGLWWSSWHRSTSLKGGRMMIRPRGEK